MNRKKGKLHSQSGSQDRNTALSVNRSESSDGKDREQRTGSTPVAGNLFSHFSPAATRSRSSSLRAMADKQTTDSQESSFLDGPSSSQLSELGHSQQSGTAETQITNADLMQKLCANGEQLEKLSKITEELRAAIFTLQNENDELKREVADSRKREESLRADLRTALHRAQVADDKADFLEQYSRNYNLRLYYVEEPSGETAGQCEETVLNLFTEKMGLRHIRKEDIDAVHRLGENRQKNGQPRGIIVRFMSRRVRDEVILNRKKLKRPTGKSVVVVEDLTKRNYQLFAQAKAASVTKQCWTRRGKIFIKTNQDKVMQIKSKGDLPGQ